MYIKIRILLLILILLITKNIITAQKKKAIVVLGQQGEDVKRSTIIEANGFAFLSEDKTLSYLRKEALINAKREALEKGEIYIKSITTMKNFQIDYDYVQTIAEGNLKILESRDNGITPDNRYHYWIKAEISYDIQIPNIKNSEDFTPSLGGPLTVSIKTGKKVYKRGEKIKISLKGNKDFFARVIYINAENKVLQLLPNQHRTDNFFKGSKKIVIPEKDDKFELEVASPFGKEKIIVYTSTAQQGKIDLNELGESLYSVNSDLTTVASKTRGVKIVKKDTESNVGAEFFEASCEVTTQLK